MENSVYLDIPSESPRKPKTSPLMSPKTPNHKSVTRSLGSDTANNQQVNTQTTPVSAGFDVKFKGSKTWTITTRVDLGPNVLDEARFRDAATDVSWADIEAFSKEIGISLPPPLHILLPALRGSLIRRWMELVAVERGVQVVLQFLHAEDVMLVPPRLNRVFSRAYDEVPIQDHLILG